MRARSGATIARHGRLARREVIVGEAATEPRDTIGMTAEEMHAYLEALLRGGSRRSGRGARHDR